MNINWCHVFAFAVEFECCLFLLIITYELSLLRDPKRVGTIHNKYLTNPKSNTRIQTVFHLISRHMFACEAYKYDTIFSDFA